MKINSKTGYRRNRVKNGHGPHRMLEMIQKEGLEKRTKREEKDSDSSLKAEEITLSHDKLTGVKE
ncbi:MAG: hypothetical protein ACW97O_10025, partial [Candidatus Thorarchaeota archaeon]|jgi:hypothetical protein